MPMDQIKAWRSELKVQQAALEQTFLKNTNPASLLKKHTKLIDNLLRKVWQYSDLNNEITLIAVGGYGRQALFPYSDIDLLILMPDNASAAQNKKVEALVGVLWDLGLNIGHSVRTLQECISEATDDATVQTNLLESRLICGSKVIYTQFFIEIKQQLNAAAFLDAKIAEQNKRHAKFNDTGYSLEPNIKESPGGLRDIHTILWLAQSQGLGNNWLELAKNGVISEFELSEIKRHERNLNTLRIRLHYLAKRREDRLLFDFQNDLANSLGLVNTPSKRASEQLMQSYYRSVRYINLINEILLKSFAIRSVAKASSTVINKRFIAQNKWLEAVTPDLFQNQPSAILECFLLLQQHPELEGFSPLLLRQLQDATKLINKAFRESTENQALFLTILKQQYGVHQSMRRMNRYGVLGKYIPAFGKIIGQMQHDLFHVYTVDEHTLKLLANLRRFSKPQLAHEFPLCSQLFADFKQPHLLYLAAIFHDIAKGRGGDHSELGKMDAKRFCALHQLPEEDTKLVVWLVEKHLQLSKVAQKSDLSDPAVIAQFAKLMKNETCLIALYLLTVADIRATSPAVWNAWKAKLLESLFLETRQALNDPSFSVKNAISERQDKARVKLNKYGLSPSAYEAFWRNVGEAYFSRFNSNEIAWQTRLLIPHVFTEVPIVRAHLSRDGDGIEVMIYTRNHQELFARICNFFDRIGYSIGQAKIYTTNHDYALNTFIVLDESTTEISYTGLIKHIEENLRDKMLTTCPIDNPIQGRLNRQVKHMPITTEVMFNTMPETSYQMFDIIAGDQPGLLASIAFVLIAHDIKVHHAKINTLGNRAEDTFLISDRQNKPLSKTKLAQLQAALIQI
ncbi:MAG: [protein-PII] uridylyltransferase [Methylophilaceae bacterium]|nr:MAG: [protein-PII] uridylyltransferase [Methylophilaceae bacterium]